ncbi:MAG: single-stranded DNA-binding protein [Lentimicrobiaceae bacterium]|nr:single-stranded DNA-binding protein [Lentimicrobiaceae bacterium]
MASGVNKVILVGNLGRDPDIQNLENGVKKATFSLATSEVIKNKDGSKTAQTEWHNVVLWRGLAEIAEKYLLKGKQVYLEGKIRTRSWEDKDGNKRYITEIIGENLVLVGSPKSEHPVVEGSVMNDDYNNHAGNTNLPEDDLPF